MAETWHLKGHMLKVKYNPSFWQNTGLQKKMVTAYKQNALWQITQDNETLHQKMEGTSEDHWNLLDSHLLISHYLIGLERQISWCNSGQSSD
jgi:hypothetical protein